MKYNNAVKAVMDGSVANVPGAVPEDYVQDELVFCGVCRTRKQMRLEILGETRIVPVMCNCQKEANAKREAEEKLRKQMCRRERMRAEGMSDLTWQGVSFVHDDRRDAVASLKCRNYVKFFPQMRRDDVGLMLYGGLGSGKTFLAGCIANALIEQGYSVMMHSLPTLIAKMNAEFGKNRETHLSRLERCDLVVLDDVGTERSTKYSVEQAYEIINTRYKAGLPLVIATSLKPMEMKNEMNFSRRQIYDRLIYMCKPLLVHGESRRTDIANDQRAATMELLNASRE